MAGIGAGDGNRKYRWLPPVFWNHEVASAPGAACDFCVKNAAIRANASECDHWRQAPIRSRRESDRLAGYWLASPLVQRAFHWIVAYLHRNADHRPYPARPEIRSIEMASPKQPFNTEVLTPSPLHQVLMLITSGEWRKTNKKTATEAYRRFGLVQLRGEGLSFVMPVTLCSYSGRFIFRRKAAKRGSCAKFFKRGST